LIEAIKKGPDTCYGLIYTFFHIFCNTGGFNSLLVLMDPIKLKEINKISETEIALENAIDLLKVFTNIKEIMGIEPKKELFKIAKENILLRIIQINPKEIKDLNKKSINNWLNDIKGILRFSYSEDEIIKIIEEHELNFILKMLISPYFDKQLKAISDLNEKIDHVCPKIQQNLIFADKAEKLVDWIKKVNLLSILYSENSHQEIIKKSLPILKFLATQRIITKEMIEIMWNSQINKHEDIIRAIYFSFEGIIEFLPLNVYFCHLLK